MPRACRPVAPRNIGEHPEPTLNGHPGRPSGEAPGHERIALMALTAGRDGERPLDRCLTPQHVDGVLLLSLHGDDPLPRQLRERGLLVVLGGRPAGEAPGAYVDVDNVGGARAGVAHLLERGRRRIATVSGPLDMTAGQDRLAGYRAALADAGLVVDDELVQAGDFSEVSGVQAMRALLGRTAGAAHRRRRRRRGHRRRRAGAAAGAAHRAGGAQLLVRFALSSSGDATRHRAGGRPGSTGLGCSPGGSAAEGMSTHSSR